LTISVRGFDASGSFYIFSFAILKNLIHNNSSPFSCDMTTPMKTLPATIACLITLVSSTLAAGLDYKILKITPALNKSPLIQYTQADQKRTPSPPLQWLEVEVEFLAQPELTDELTFKYFIWIGDKVLSGEVTNIDVFRGRDLVTVVYVSPKTLQKLSGAKGSPLTAVQNVAVQIFNKGQLVDGLSLKPGKPDWWTAIPQVSGLVLNKNETPFAPLYWDRYEVIKPAAH
jgi:hypothetical protein